MAKFFILCFKHKCMGLSIPKIKPIKISSDRLICLQSVNKQMYPEQARFVLFSKKTGEVEGEMLCHKSSVDLRDDYLGKTLAIDFIRANERKQGVGTVLIDFAKKLSAQMGCNGYIFLKADPFITPNSAPHIFYRKCGFSTLDEKFDSKIDKYIKKNKDASWKDMPAKLMYYPPKSKDKLSFLEKIKNFFVK